MYCIDQCVTFKDWWHIIYLRAKDTTGLCFPSFCYWLTDWVIVRCPRVIGDFVTLKRVSLFDFKYSRKKKEGNKCLFFKMNQKKMCCILNLFFVFFVFETLKWFLSLFRCGALTVIGSAPRFHCLRQSARVILSVTNWPWRKARVMLSLTWDIGDAVHGRAPTVYYGICLCVFIEFVSTVWVCSVVYYRM